MKTVWLHIGRHKTGTTNLQFFLSENEEQLRQSGVCYPQAGRFPPHEASERDRVAHHRLAALLLKPEAFKEQLEELRRELLEEVEPFDTVIISSEGLQNISDTNALKLLLEGFEVRVICYFREQLSYAASAYAQEVQTSNTFADFETFAKYFNAVSGYVGFMTRWSQVSSEGVWRLYDRMSLRDGDIVTDFIDATGLPLTTRRASATDRNISISGNALGFKLLVNAFGMHGPIHPHVLGLLAQQHARFSGAFCIDPNLQDRIRQGNKNNDTLRRLFGDLPLRDFSTGNVILDPETYADDFEIIVDAYEKAPEAISAVPRLGKFLRWLSKCG